MTELNSCNCSIGCTLKGIILSIILGVLASFLTITGIITLTDPFLWVVLGVSLVYLPVALIAAALNHTNTYCICRAIEAFLIGVIGSVITSLVLLAITFAVTSVVGAIISGLLILFFFLIITSTACLIRCIFACNND